MGVRVQSTCLPGRRTVKEWLSSVTRIDWIRQECEKSGPPLLQIDHEFSGLSHTIECDGAVMDHTKVRTWKEAYHDCRAPLNVTERLRKLAGIEVNK
jgi:hypothetical protein